MHSDIVSEALIEDKHNQHGSKKPDNRQLAYLGHELRTPLNAINGFATLLKRDLNTALLPAHTRWLDLILEAADHLTAVVDQFLSPGRPAQPGVAPQSIDIVSAVDSCMALLRGEAERYGVRLAILPPPDETRPLASTNPTMLRQVLLNVLTNAIKYNRTDGEVTVAVWQDASMVHIGVEDTGQGMTEDQLRQLFEPYNRLGREGGPVPGLGIGLSLVRELMGKMGGRVDVRSAPGQGTTVRLAIARHPAD